MIIRLETSISGHQPFNYFEKARPLTDLINSLDNVYKKEETSNLDIDTLNKEAKKFSKDTAIQKLIQCVTGEQSKSLLLEKIVKCVLLSRYEDKIVPSDKDRILTELSESFRYILSKAYASSIEDTKYDNGKFSYTLENDSLELTFELPSSIAGPQLESRESPLSPTELEKLKSLNSKIETPPNSTPEINDELTTRPTLKEHELTATVSTSDNALYLNENKNLTGELSTKNSSSAAPLKPNHEPIPTHTQKNITQTSGKLNFVFGFGQHYIPHTNNVSATTYVSWGACMGYSTAWIKHVLTHENLRSLPSSEEAKLAQIIFEHQKPNSTYKGNGPIPQYKYGNLAREAFYFNIERILNQPNPPTNIPPETSFERIEIANFYGIKLGGKALTMSVSEIVERVSKPNDSSTPRAYLVCTSAHAMAIARIGEELAFFDSNQGVFICPNKNPTDLLEVMSKATAHANGRATFVETEY